MSARIGAISAVVCNYQGERYLPACLASLAAQSEPLDEILVVDDASSDASVALVEREFPSVRVVRRDVNGGPCAARNDGMRAARNRWVLAVDNDAVLEADVVAKLRAALEARPEVVASQPRSVFHDEPARVHYDGARFHYVGLYALRNFCVPLAEATGAPIEDVDGLIGITMLIDRDAVLACGGYDEDLFYLAEDYDLALRMRVAGHRFVSVEDALVLHRGGTPGMSFRGAVYPRRRAYFHARNRWILMAKSHGVRTLVLSLPGIALYELVWLVFATWKGHLGATLAGKLAFLRTLGATLRKRAVVQRTRVVRDRDLLVGGPLTLSPQLVAKPVSRRLARGVGALLSGWWALVGRLVS